MSSARSLSHSFSAAYARSFRPPWSKSIAHGYWPHDPFTSSFLMTCMVDRRKSFTLPDITRSTEILEISARSAIFEFVHPKYSFRSLHHSQNWSVVMARKFGPSQDFPKNSYVMHFKYGFSRSFINDRPLYHFR